MTKNHEEIIKIVCIHPNINNIEEMIRYYCIENLEVCGRLKWDEDKPDIAIVSECIYNNVKINKLFKKLYMSSNRTIFVFHAGEAVTPDFNIFDYALVYNDTMQEQDRVCRLPPEIFHGKGLVFKENPHSYSESYERVKNGMLKFCNFIYSNPEAHPYRDQLFLWLNEYKKVDSLGKHMHNTNIPITRGNANWKKISIDLKSNYKFTIACENELFTGYTTEKLITTFQAGSIPIYWGNPNISKEFNPEAFINCHDFANKEDLLKRIEEIDKNDELWASIISKSWKTKKQIEEYERSVQKYYSFMNDILSGNFEDSIRRPIGTWTNIYYKWFFRRFVHFSILYKLKRFFKRFIPKLG